jgi:hypothetical protein
MVRIPVQFPHLEGAIDTDASGTNPGMIVVGVYFDASFNEHGFIRTP